MAYRSRSVKVNTHTIRDTQTVLIVGLLHDIKDHTFIFTIIVVVVVIIIIIIIIIVVVVVVIAVVCCCCP